MPDDINDIIGYYDRNVENEHGRLVRHPVEHDVTWRYLDKYLPSRGKILDIGAATGAYTIPLAEKGYSVTAVDLSPGLIAECKKQVGEHGLENSVTCLVADARDLSQVKDKDYDAVLLMGPLYHLMSEEDRLKAIKEAFFRLKSGGVLFSSHISRYGIWGNVMAKIPHMIELKEDVFSVLEKGQDLPSWGPGFRAYFALVPEIAPLHERCGLRTQAVAGVELVADGPYSNLNEEQRKLWLDLLVRISTEPSIIGASCHLLYIGEKSG